MLIWMKFLASKLPDGVEIRGQKFVVTDWPAYIGWHKKRDNIPKILTREDKCLLPQEGALRSSAGKQVG
jgi:hypothetical protein